MVDSKELEKQFAKIRDDIFKEHKRKQIIMQFPFMKHIYKFEQIVKKQISKI